MNRFNIDVGIHACAVVLILSTSFFTSGCQSNSSTQSTSLPESALPMAVQIGKTAFGYGIYEFIDPKTGRRLLLYRECIIHDTPMNISLSNTPSTVEKEK